MVTREYWDDRYGSAPTIWSGRPNPHLVDQVTGLAPGAALDVGCGEGADAIWLARSGWQVTGIDISQVALDRAAGVAAAAGADVAGRISWQQVDLLGWTPPDQQFDLVSAQFMHLPRPALAALHRGLAAAVRPGGTLLIVGHHPSDLQTSMGRPDAPEMFYTAEQLARQLDSAEWRIVVAGAPEREAADPDGRMLIVRDAVLNAVRRD